ncbi:MAG: hypothetical protein R3F55_25050 [Alphaproteobacteria bacterium]
MRRPAACAALIALAGCQSTGSQAPTGGLAIEPAVYVGSSEGELRAALGQPDSARNELDAQVWQYAGPDCVVDFFMYPQGGVQVVAYAEARNRTDGATLARCAVRAG